MRYALYRLKWWLAQWIDFSSPIHVDIEVTSSCNLRCPICHQTDTPRVYALGKMKKPEIFQRMKEASELGAMSIKWNWRGEALIHADIWDCFRYAHELGFVDTMINTNLSVKMTEEQIRLLASLRTIKVSMDSVTNYAVARAGGDRDLVFDNIVRLMRYRDRLEVNRHQSAITEPFEEFQDAFFMQIANRVGFVKASLLMGSINLHNHVAQERNHNAGMFHSSTAGKERVYCKMPSRRLLVSGTTGSVYPCCVPYAEHKELRMGGRETTLRQAWENPARAALVRELKSGRLPNPACLSCTSSDAWRTPGRLNAVKRLLGVRAW